MVGHRAPRGQSVHSTAPPLPLPTAYWPALQDTGTTVLMLGHANPLGQFRQSVDAGWLVYVPGGQSCIHGKDAEIGKYNCKGYY